MKRKNQKVSTWYILLLLSVIVYSCMSEDVKTTEPTTSTVRFTMAKLDETGRSASVDDVRYAVVGVDRQDGTTILRMEKLELFNFNGSLISEEVELEVDDYSLTDFLLTDEDGNVLFATPKEGSTYASYVDDPLPIEFSVWEDSVSTIVPQVIAVEGDPEDYGYVVFGFEVVELDSLHLSGELLGLGWSDQNTLLFGSLSYDGTETIIADLGLSKNEVPAIYRYSHDNADGYYSFSYWSEKEETMVLTTLDQNGEVQVELIDNGYILDFGNLTLNELENRFYGCAATVEEPPFNLSRETYYFGYIDWDGKETIISYFHPKYVTVFGPEIINNGTEFSFVAFESNRRASIITIDSEGNELNNVVLYDSLGSQENLMGLDFNEADQAYYFMKNSEFVKLLPDGNLIEMGSPYGDFENIYPSSPNLDQENQAYIYATYDGSSTSVKVVDLEGNPLSSMDSDDFEVSSLRATN